MNKPGSFSHDENFYAVILACPRFPEFVGKIGRVGRAFGAKAILLDIDRQLVLVDDVISMSVSSRGHAVYHLERYKEDPVGYISAMADSIVRACAYDD